MKTKIFALFAAMMLLMGTTAMAQSGDTKTSKTTETEIKGDVNNDGVVDVADIAAVIAVMHEQGTVETQYYWYVGQTEVTTDNYTTLATTTTEKLTSIDYTTEKFGKVYILTPDIVTSIKIFEYSANNYGRVTPTVDTSFNVPGYKCWVTSAMGGEAPQRYDFVY